MTKFWTAGKVKTRLGKTIGMVPAAELHELFVAKLCDSLANTADERSLCITPTDDISKVRSALRQWQVSPKWRVVPQSTGDLGDRMCSWFKLAMETHANQAAILIGGDCPLLTDEDISEAAGFLDRSDVVIGPAYDGGYYLLGMSGPWRPEMETIFHGIPWSTSSVLSLTRQKLSQAKITFTELQQREDVDTEIELAHLLQAHRKSQQKAGRKDEKFFRKIHSILESSMFPDEVDHE
jgi:rSAM/selenodomain-associated transferase 1